MKRLTLLTGLLLLLFTSCSKDNDADSIDAMFEAQLSGWTCNDLYPVIAYFYGGESYTEKACNGPWLHSFKTFAGDTIKFGVGGSHDGNASYTVKLYHLSGKLVLAKTHGPINFIVP